MTTSVPTILIVDDELSNRKLLEALLHPEGYQTMCASSGEEALAAIARQAPDLILLDIMMPGMDGYQVASILKADAVTSNIPIILVTAHVERSARMVGLAAGAEEFLTKPVDRSELWLRVRNLLRLKAFSDFLRDPSRGIEDELRLRTADLQRFRTAMDGTADAILLMNHDTMRFVDVNATASNMFGYSREELLEMGPKHLEVAPLEKPSSAYAALIAGEGRHELKETRLRHKDGTELPVEVRRHAQRFGAQWIIIDMVRDMSGHQTSSP